MSVRALLTGATGMLGSYIAEQLLTEGWRVRSLVRDPPRAARLAELGVELVHGSLENAESLVRAADGCTVIFHAAAAIGSGGDWESFHRGNVQGTKHVVAAAEAHGARLVHVSSTSVFGAERYFDRPTDEAVPLPRLPEHDVYGRSKQDAERVVLGAHADGRIRGVVVRPPVMYGLRDRQFLPRVGPVFARGAFPLIDSGRTTLALVHAGNVASGAILAARCDSADGRVYHLTNDYPVDTALLVRCAAQGLGRNVWSPVVSRRTGRLGFAALAFGLRLVGRGDLAKHASGTLNMLTRNNPFSSERARTELGWRPQVTPEVGLTEAFRWWKDNSGAGV